MTLQSGYFSFELLLLVCLIFQHLTKFWDIWLSWCLFQETYTYTCKTNSEGTVKVKSTNVGGTKTYLPHFHFFHLFFQMISLLFDSISYKSLFLKFVFQNDYFLSRHNGHLIYDNSLVTMKCCTTDYMLTPPMCEQK